MTKPIIRKYLQFNDPEGLERAYRAWSVIFPETPYPDAEGVRTMLQDLAPKMPKAAASDPKAFVDMSFVHALDRSGYIRQLYKW
jgi:hypothetical protein